MKDQLEDATRVLVITASEPLPRITPQFCAYENTWPGKLRRNFYVYQCSLGGSSLGNIYIQVKTYHIAFKPDYVILQTGINDCAPRALKRTELSILKSFSLGRWFLERVVKRYSDQLRRYRNITYTPPKTYSRLIENIKELFPEAKVMGLSILRPFDAHERKVPGLTKNVLAYNQILESHLGEGYISIEGVPEQGVMPDFMHFNQLGHKFLYDRIVERIDHLSKSPAS